MPLFKKKSEKRSAGPQVSRPTQGAKPVHRTTTSQPVQGAGRPVVTSTNLTPGPHHVPRLPGPPAVQQGVQRERPPVITGTATEIANGESGQTKKRPQPAIMSIEEAKASLQRELSDEENKYGDLGTASASGKLTSTGLATKSRICKTMTEVLHDNGALPYFIQYMEMLDAVHMVQFWLATESFSTASWSRLRSDAFKSASKNQNLSRNSTTKTCSEEKPPKSEPTSTEKDNVKSDENANNDLGLSIVSNAQSSAKTDPASPTNSSEDSTNGDEQDNASNNSVKTHSRTRSDSALGMGKTVSWSDSGSGADSPGHRRNHSWKGVDQRTAVERDATNIYTRYICKDASYSINVTEDIRLEVIAKMCPQEGTVNPDCFKTAQVYVFDVMEKQYFPSFLTSDFHCKYQIDVLTSGKVYLADILDHDTATFHFMEYLEQEGAVHLLQFWLAAENFQKHLLSQQGQYDGMEAQSDAMVLYDQYFSLQATHPIGFDDGIRLEVESNICREGGPIPDCFSTPMRRAYTTLETVYFPGFLQNELYYKFLTELINTVKPEQKPSGLGGGQSHPEPDNKSTAEGQQNTLLAEGNVRKLFDESDMNIDWGILNPDSLWQRPESGNMTFGSVNHLGQFVAEYEPDPDLMHKKSTVSKFSLRKFMSKEEDPAKEEMALKIAQKIINDVNLQTGSSSGSSTPQHPSPVSGSITSQASGSPTISKGTRRKGSAGSQH